MGGGAWWAIVHEVTKSQIQLSDFHFLSFLTLPQLVVQIDMY